jgi:Tol biopolymer transport system component
MSVRGLANEERASITVPGLVSHVRWSVASNQIVFTLNRPATGTIWQDLYVWNLETGSPAVRLTQDLRSKGGEYRGVVSRYRL